MLIVNPSVELLPYNGEAIKHVCKCARVCYDKESGNSDERLYNDLINKHHWSVFRHASYYAIVPEISFVGKEYTRAIITGYKECPYLDFIYDIDSYSYYIATNGNFMFDNCETYETDIYKLISNYLVSPEEFANTEIGHSMMRYTFRITTQDSTAKEINRVSPNNITEMSTRYVDLKNGGICKPHWLEGYSISKGVNGAWYIDINGDADEDVNHKVLSYLQSCESSFNTYKYLIEAGLRREDARGVLPKDTMTKVIYTYSVKEWTDIINKRVNMIYGRAHENAKIVISMVKKELEQLGYDFEQK